MTLKKINIDHKEVKKKNHPTHYGIYFLINYLKNNYVEEIKNFLRFDKSKNEY